MFKFVKKGTFMFLVAGLAMGMASCDDDDPDYDNVTPPEVEVAPAQISGVVTSMDGTAVSGATVKATVSDRSVTATTKADGTYVLEDVAVGTYAMEVAADGKLTDTGEVKISKDGETIVYNAMLASDVKVEVAVSATEDVSDKITTEVPEENKEAEVTTTATISAAAIEDMEAKIILTPVYSEKASARSKAVTRAARSTMFMGVEVSCSKEGVDLKKPVRLEFDLGEDVVAVVTVMKNVDGTWEKVNAEKNGGKITVDADQFGIYSVWAEMEITFGASKETVKFSQDEFDNLYGSKDMQVGSVTYTYKQGGTMGEATGRLNAQLRQILTRQIKGNKVTEATGTYPLNVTLPVGTALTLKGTQEVTRVTVKETTSGKSVSGSVYGSVSVEASTYNRKHNGGTSSN